MARRDVIKVKSSSLSRENSAKIGINEDLWRTGLLLCNMQLASSKTQTFYCVIEIVKFASC